ncbi:pantetheine-phosphate adenylyltransferase [Candidatus Odyssella thessalonicensis]|uniref:pantetheine-phosphate adenylyltransferase n=1 Tax=Candidatus Odyssella thessalonicensis TaxID=84647 RepID=UPI000225B1A9|nr:pantetheine-phosphate adenylyltransferase [Candidatus Odyssella thessalonicensis]
MKIGIYPGSFDPLTLGHLEIIQRAARLVDRLYICVAVNQEKSTLFNLEQRLLWVNQAIAQLESKTKLEALAFEGLIVDIATSLKADIIIRGLRNTTDMDYESQIAATNKKLVPTIETVCLLAYDYPFISSTMVRSVLKNSGNISAFVPPMVACALADKQR